MKNSCVQITSADYSICIFIIHQDRNVHNFSIVLPCGELVNKRQCYSPKGE